MEQGQLLRIHPGAQIRCHQQGHDQIPFPASWPRHRFEAEPFAHGVNGLDVAVRQGPGNHQ